MKKILHFSLLLIFSTLFTSCSANRLLSSWKDTSLDEYRLQNLLVVGVSQDETKRRIYEDTFVTSFKKVNVQAVPSYTVCKEAIKPSEKALREVIDKTGAGAVLITHLVGKNETNYFQPDRRLNLKGSSTFSGLYGYYPLIYHSVYTPGGSTSTTKIILETNLYDVQSEKLLWSARSQSIDPVMTRKYYQELINLFLDELKKNDFI